MALDAERKRAAAITVGTPGVPPSVRPDGVLGLFDRYQTAWSYRAAALGALLFFGTEVSDVTDNWGGVTFDDGGNLNASGAVFEAGV